MRIISGIHKGRRFSPPKAFKARPTTDFARENLFNVLANTWDYEDLKILDLFAGTGSIGFEFASRGCENITAVELESRHVAFIKEVSEKLRLEGYRVIKSDAFRFVDRCRESFDIIFADPPYDNPDLKTIPDLIFKRELLAADGLLIVEHGKSTNFGAHPCFVDKRVYGSVNFSFFKRNDAETA